MRGMYLVGVACLTLAAVPASAQWHQASSKHFVIYGDMPEAELRDYATRLETFDAAARLIRSMKDPTVGDGNRVQVLVVPSLLDVNRSLGSAEAGVSGYYRGSVSGPIIVTPRKTRRLSDSTIKQNPENVFFHEYTHHLMLQNTNTPMPPWLTEGFAEFLSEPRFGTDGSIGLGTPVTDRAEQLYKGRWAPMADLLEGNAEKLFSSGLWYQNYAQGWLLNHYLAFEPTRKGQLEKYVAGISTGKNALVAARDAFGDLGKLDAELQEYRGRKAWPYVKIDASKLKVPPVTIERLAPGAAEAMPLRVHVKTGYGSVSTDYVVKKLREIAARHPSDGLVFRTLAEAEYDAENFAEAEAAADAALKIDPKSVEAIIYKGRGLLARGKKTGDAKLISAARAQFVAANQIDPEDPEPLYLFYRTYRASSGTAPKSAVEALHYATVLAPQDNYVGLQLVMEHLRQSDLKAAATALKPIAFAPDAGQSKTNDALQVLKMIEAGKGAEALAKLEEEMKKVSEKDSN